MITKILVMTLLLTFIITVITVGYFADVYYHDFQYNWQKLKGIFREKLTI